MSEGVPTEQELREALEKIKVSDVLVETMQGLASLGYHRLNAETRDLDETRLAIEALFEWVLPVAEELGVASQLAIPVQNSAERQYARLAEGLTPREIYAELARPREVVG